MESYTSTAGTGLGCLMYYAIYGLFGLSYFGGVYHSFSYHSTIDNVVVVAFPPWAVLRGIESTWHDYDKQLDKKKKHVINQGISILNMQGLEGNEYNLNEYLLDYSDKIGELPNEIKTEVDVILRMYANFMKSYNSDLVASFSEAGFFRSFEISNSDRTISLGLELSELGYNEFVQDYYDDLELASKMFKETYGSSNYDLPSNSRRNEIRTKVKYQMEALNQNIDKILNKLVGNE